MLNKIIDYMFTTVFVVAMLVFMAGVFEFLFGIFSGDIPIWMKWILERNGG